MSTFLKDDFTGTGPLSAHAVSGTGATGGSWIVHPVSAGALVLNNGFVQSTDNTSRFSYNDVNPGADDYSLSCAYGIPEGISGPRVRQDSVANTCYEAIYYGSVQEVRLYRWNANVGTLLETWAGLSTCDSLKLEVSGVGATVNLKVYKDGSATALTPAGFADSSADRIVARGYAALRSYGTSIATGGITSIEGVNALAATATSVTLSGPTSGTTGVASTNFTATTDQPVTVDTPIATVTAGNGTFSPSAPVILAGTSSVTFTYTPSASQTANISITNSAGLTVLGSPIAYTSSAANTAPTFSGTIANISATQGSAISSVNVSSMFSDAESSLTFTAVGSWPSGITVSTAGVISGTPSASGTFGSLQVRATDAGGLTATSNAFTITVAAAATGSITTTPYRNIETGALMASTTIAKVYVIDRVNDTLAVLTNQTTNASGQLVINSLVAGRTYMIVAAEAVQSPVTDTGSAAGHFGAV